jgi:hypothetical protein
VVGIIYPTNHAKPYARTYAKPQQNPDIAFAREIMPRIDSLGAILLLINVKIEKKKKKNPGKTTFIIINYVESALSIF